MQKLTIESLGIEIEIQSIKKYYRNLSTINNFLQNYMFEMNTEYIRNEIKNGIIEILNTKDIQDIRRDKLQQIDNFSGIIKEQTPLSLNISFEINKDTYATTFS